MNRHQGSALTAGVLCFQFAVFSAAVLWLWLGDSPWEAHREVLRTIPGAIELLAVIVLLMVASTLLGGWLAIRRSVNRTVLFVGVAIAAIAIWWSVTVAAFWTLPIAFMWVSYRAKNDG